jgi:glycosyltransferase involved in cell wall biosynthesis
VGDSRVALAYVGSVVEESRGRQYPGYSAGGGRLQEGLLESLEGSGISLTGAFSVRPVSSFPRVRRLWFRTERTETFAGAPIVQLPFVNLKVARTLSLGLSLFPRLIQWARRHSADSYRAMLVYNGVNPPALVSLAAARLTASKILAFVADVQVPGAGLVPDNLLRRLEFRLQVRSLPRFDGLVVVAPAVVEDFAPEVPFLVIEGGIPRRVAEEFSSVPSAACSTSVGGEFRLMYAGALSHLKGVPLLLDAFSLLPGDHYRLWVAGDGPCRQLVEKAAGRDERIRYLGVLESGRTRALYSEASVLINPHLTGPRTARYVFPSKLVEYLASGRPVITTWLPGMDPRYSDCTFVLKKESPEALAALTQAASRLTDDERQTLGRRGREFVVSEKTWERQGTRVAAFIRSVVGADGLRSWEARESRAQAT